MWLSSNTTAITELGLSWLQVKFHTQAIEELKVHGKSVRRRGNGDN